MRLVPVRRATMRPHAWLMDAIEVRAYRHTIETVMKIENLIHYTALAVGLKPSAMQGEARLRGL